VGFWGAGTNPKAGPIKMRVKTLSFYLDGRYIGDHPESVRDVFTTETLRRAKKLADLGTNCGIEVSRDNGKETIRDRETGFEL
jgi:hypothetical protein